MKVVAALLVLVVVGAVAAWPVEEEVKANPLHCLKQAVIDLTKFITSHEEAAGIAVGYEAPELRNKIVDYLKQVGLDLAKCLMPGEEKDVIAAEYTFKTMGI